MVHRPASWFRNAAVLSFAVGVALVPAVNYLIHGSLPLWLHIPLTAAALTLMAGSAVAAGVAMVEYRARQDGASSDPTGPS